MEILNESLSEITKSFDIKRKFFDDGYTHSYAFRKEALLKLRNAIIRKKEEIIAAMQRDFGKPSFEAYIGEVGVATDDINFVLKHLKSWMEDKHVPTPIAIQPAKSKIIYEPKGVVMIFSPWNYPFNLTIIPLIGAIAAGNCVMIKPAHETPHIAKLIKILIEECFIPEHVSVVMGEGKIIGELLLTNFTFNHIFFTGSPNTGRWIMEKAARTLTPVTLELGGKSPVIIDSSANMKVALNRITWAKYFNAGQTCTSPDYILVHKSRKDEFTQGLIKKIEEFFGADPQKSPYYCRLVNNTRFKKIVTYLEQGKILHGGLHDETDKYISPTVMELNDLDVPLMKEEIFGPILPVIPWSDKEEIVQIIRKNRYPLTCYIFSEDTQFINYIHERVEFGSGCVNDTMAQFANSNFPFGGVMTSGMGKYHGKYSFDTFSNAKPILSSATFIDIDMRYPPYTSFKRKLAEFFLE